MSASSPAVGGVARYPVLAFMLISLAVGFVTAAIPPIVDSEILPFGLPLHGVLISLGAGLAAFAVTAALSGRAGVADLGRRSRGQPPDGAARARRSYTGSNTARFLIFSGVIVLFGTAVIIATKGQLGRRAAAQSVEGNIAGDQKPQSTTETLKSSRRRRWR